ncbi:MAG: MFS transporter [Chlamydiales bacterium]|nr:MFS transporter [Chlamydiales bacterium]
MTISGKKNFILIAMICCTSLIFLNATLFPVALPTIQRELSVSLSTLQWIINAYLLATAIFVIAGGRLADLFGARRIFCLGVGIYSLASVMGAFAESGWWLVMSRAIQGTGGAMMSPAGMSLLIHAFPENKRGKAIGIVVAVGSLFLSLGPFVGGAFTQYLSWRWAFWINPPIAAFGIIMMLKAVPKSVKQNETFDFLGFFTMSAAITCLTIGLMEGKKWGWESWQTIFFLLLAITFFLAVRGLERFSPFPFFKFSLFRNRTFLGGCLLIICAQFLLMITVFWPLFFQKIITDSPMIAGLITAIGTIPLMLFAPISGNLADRRGPRLPLAIGFALLLICFLWFAYFLQYQKVALLFPALFAFGAGISFVMTPASAATLSAVPKTKTGVATGMYNTLRFTGATIGVAVLGAVQVNVQDALFRDKLLKGPGTAALDPPLFEGLLNNLPRSVEAAKALKPQVLDYINKGLIETSTTAFAVTNLVTALVAFLAFVVTLLIFKKKVKERDEDL